MVAATVVGVADAEAAAVTVADAIGIAIASSLSSIFVQLQNC
jgi:hypothetical protein